MAACLASCVSSSISRSPKVRPGSFAAIPKRADDLVPPPERHRNPRRQLVKKRRLQRRIEIAVVLHDHRTAVEDHLSHQTRARRERLRLRLAGRLCDTVNRRGASRLSPIKLIAPPCACSNATALSTTVSSSGRRSRLAAIDSAILPSARVAGWPSPARRCVRPAVRRALLRFERLVPLDVRRDEAREHEHQIDLVLPQLERAAVVGAEGAEETIVVEQDRHADVALGADDLSGRECVYGSTSASSTISGVTFEDDVAKRRGPLDRDRRLDPESDPVVNMGDDDGVAFEAMDHREPDTDPVAHQAQRHVDDLVERVERPRRQRRYRRKPRDGLVWRCVRQSRRRFPWCTNCHEDRKYRTLHVGQRGHAPVQVQSIRLSRRSMFPR